MSYEMSSLEWREWSCTSCKQTARTVAHWAQKYACPHAPRKNAQPPWLTTAVDVDLVARLLGDTTTKKEKHHMENVRDEIYKLSLDQLNEIADRFDKQDWKVRNRAGNKARHLCYESVPGWMQETNVWVNALLRTIRAKAGPMDSSRVSGLMAAFEMAAWSQMVKDQLDEKEYDLLWSPVGPALEAVADEPKAAIRHVAPVAFQANAKAEEPDEEEIRAAALALFGDDEPSEQQKADFLAAEAADVAPPAPDLKASEKTEDDEFDLDDLLSGVA